MKIKTYRLSRTRQQIDIKELDLNKFERIGTTGSGLAFKYKKGKTIFTFGEWVFKEMLKSQKQNEEMVKNKSYSYARIDENESSSKQNTLRDKNGKPIKIYTKPKDCYSEIKHLRYITENDFDIARKYWEKEDIFMECYGCKWDLDGIYI